MHGWCAEKENRGKGGSGKGNIGAGVVSCQSMDPVGTQSGPSRAPILAFLGTAFGPSGFLGTTFGPVGKQQKSPKNVQKHCKNAIFYGPKAVPKNAKIGARLGPDWIPTGSRRAKSGAQKC